MYALIYSRVLFFFFKQKTAYEMRISDWSSDVCSSDLLCTLPGIGAWTAHYIAMRALSHPDAFPAGDLILRQVLGNGSAISERDCAARSQPWRPWRAYAVLHLWHLSSELARERTS